VGKRRELKFNMQVDHSKSQPTDDELSVKRAWSCHVTFQIFSPPLWNGLSYRDFKFGVKVDHNKSGHGHVISSNFGK